MIIAQRTFDSVCSLSLTGLRSHHRQQRACCRPAGEGAAPVEYVRVCSTYGAGFFYLPGTESCLRIGGRVRADYLYSSRSPAQPGRTGFRARGRLNIDHRTMTAYGLLRTYIRYEIDRNSGVFAGTGEISTNPKIQQAFIQFGRPHRRPRHVVLHRSESAGAELR